MDVLGRLLGGQSSIDDRVRVDVHAVVAAEPDDLYDTNAIAVWVQGLKAGYLSREDARRLGPGPLALEQRHGMPIALSGGITGGGCEWTGQDDSGCSSTRPALADLAQVAPGWTMPAS
jgi:hypothetical protein